MRLPFTSIEVVELVPICHHKWVEIDDGLTDEVNL